MNLFILSQELNSWFFIINFFLILFLFYFVFKISKKFNVSLFLLSSLYFYHLSFSFLYIEYTYINQGDIFDYWITSEKYIIKYLNDITNESYSFLYYFYHIVGSEFILLVLGLFRFLKLDFIFTNIIFNFIGFLGIINFYLIFRRISFFDNKLIAITSITILFFPSIHFWTSSIGKDSLIFFAISLIIYNYLKKNQLKHYIFGFSIILLIRPYIGLFFFISYIVFVLVNLRFIKLRYFINLFIISFLTFISIFIAANHASINITNINIDFISNSLSTIIEERKVSFIESGSYVDISNKYFFENMLFYIFYPFVIFNSIDNLVLLVLSLENLILALTLFLSLVFFNTNNYYNSKIFFLLIFSLISLFFLSAITQNIGIILRQKWMIIPILFAIMLSVISNYQSKVRHI